MLSISKQDMLKSLPLREGEVTIRKWNRKDLDLLSKWPSYPFPYEAFNFSFRNRTSEERDRHFKLRENNPNMILMTVDHSTEPAIGYITLLQIDRAAKKVGNFGFRISPSWCDRKVGTLVLRRVCKWCLDCGLEELQMDVAASNTRAARCYEKSGFVKTGEFWREARDLEEIDIDQPQYDFLRPHIRFDGAVPQIRFIWMELRREKFKGKE